MPEPPSRPSPSSREEVILDALMKEGGPEGLNASALAEYIERALVEAGYPAIRDEGLYCPECGAPSPEGYTRETLDG